MIYEITNKVENEAKGFADRTIQAILYGSANPHSIGVTRKEENLTDDDSDKVVEQDQDAVWHDNQNHIDSM